MTGPINPKSNWPFGPSLPQGSMTASQQYLAEATNRLLAAAAIKQGAEMPSIEALVQRQHEALARSPQEEQWTAEELQRYADIRKYGAAREKHQTQPCYSIRDMLGLLRGQHDKLRVILVDRFMNELGCVLNDVNAPLDSIKEIMTKMGERLDAATQGTGDKAEEGK